MSNITFHDLRKKINLYDDLKDDNKKLQEIYEPSGDPFAHPVKTAIGVGLAGVAGTLGAHQVVRKVARIVAPNSNFAQGKTWIDRPLPGRLAGIPNPFNMSRPNIEKSGKGNQEWAQDENGDIRKGDDKTQLGKWKLSQSDNLTHPQWSEKMSDQAKLGASAAQQIHVERMNHERTTHMGSYDSLHAHAEAVKQHNDQHLDPKDTPKLTDYTGPNGATSEAKKAFKLHQNLEQGDNASKHQDQLRKMFSLDAEREKVKPFKSALPQEVHDQAKQFNSELTKPRFGTGEWQRKSHGLRDAVRFGVDTALNLLPARMHLGVLRKFIPR